MTTAPTLALAEADVALVRVLWSSVVATVVVALVFSALILCIVRASEMRAADRRAPAFLYGALSIAALMTFSAAVVYGLVLLTQKS